VAQEANGKAQEASLENPTAVADRELVKVTQARADELEQWRGAGNYDAAIADFDRAIKLDPKNAGAYCARGDVKQAKGDWDGAIADYNRCIELEPTNDEAYEGRGIANQAKGNNDLAIADYTHAIELDPDANYYFNRSTAYVVNREWASALADVRRARELNKDDQDYPIEIWLVLAEQGQQEAAHKELADDTEQPSNEAPNDWTSKVTSFLLDKINQADFLAAAASPDTEKEHNQRCDAWFYAGVKRMLAGDKATAIDYFQKALATGAKTENEYEFAGAELKALGK
jgi:lipoprotein NlpI